MLCNINVCLWILSRNKDGNNDALCSGLQNLDMDTVPGAYWMRKMVPHTDSERRQRNLGHPYRQPVVILLLWLSHPKQRGKELCPSCCINQ